MSKTPISSSPVSFGFGLRRRLAWGLGLLLWALAGVFAAAPAQAGTACETSPLTAEQVRRGMRLADATARQLDASGAEVVILARAGQDLSRYGLAWSHLAYAVREPRPAPPPEAPVLEPQAPEPVKGQPTRAEVLAELRGEPAPVAAPPSPPPPPQPLSPWVWRVVHKLNSCGTAQGGLYKQGLGEFFMDRPYRYEAAFVVPVPKVQEKLLAVLRDPERLALWHEARYSMVSYAWGTTYQQSNQWLIETMAGALSAQAADRPSAQRWLQFMRYQPGTLHIDAFTRLGARVGMANVAFDDHPNSERFADRITTVTADSVFTWLTSNGLASPLRRVNESSAP